MSFKNIYYVYILTGFFICIVEIVILLTNLLSGTEYFLFCLIADIEYWSNSYLSLEILNENTVLSEAKHFEMI